MRRLVFALVVLVAAFPAGVARAGIVTETVYVPTVDGAKIRVRLQRDPSHDPQPVLLSYSPYYDDVISGGWMRPDPFFDRSVPRGIARAHADVLGTNASSGCWDYGGAKEQQSGVDVVNALAKLPWSNGKVGMIGMSYEGTTANMVAVRGDAVPGLAAVVPINAISRWYEHAYYHGARYREFGVPTVFDLVIGRHQPPGDPTTEHYREALLARTSECGAVEHNVRAHEDSPNYDDFWLQRDYLKDAANVRVPVLLAHGWRDNNVRPHHGVQMWEAIPEDVRTTVAVEGAPFKMMYMFQAGHALPPDQQTWLPLLDAFLDRTLRGIANGVENGPRFYSEIGPGSGITTAATYPPPGTRDVALQLAHGGSLSVEQTCGPPATYTDHGARGANQLADREAGGSLLYVSPPLANATRMTGSVKLEVGVTVTSVRGQLDAIVYAVDEIGNMEKVSSGNLNLRYRDGLARAEPIPPGEQVRANVVVRAQDKLFRAGERIAIAVQSSNVAEVVPDLPATYTIDQCSSLARVPIVGAPNDPAALFD